MNQPADFGRSSQWAFDHPKYLPLDGQPAEHALELLIRKGAKLTPPLSRSDTKGIMAYMSMEHFPANSTIAFNAQSDEMGRLMMIIAGEASVRMKAPSAQSQSAYSPLGQAQSKWFSATEGATLGLLHAFSGLSSLCVAQSTTELFVASMSRQNFHRMKQHEPMLALRFLEITTLELALVTLDHERRIFALSNVARSMQDHIDEESGATMPAPLFGLSGPG